MAARWGWMGLMAAASLWPFSAGLRRRAPAALRATVFVAALLQTVGAGLRRRAPAALRATVFVAALLQTVGCHGINDEGIFNRTVAPAYDVSDHWDPVQYVDEGTFCLAVEDDRLRLVVEAPECVAASCARDVSTSCAMHGEGPVVTATSEHGWVEDTLGRCRGRCPPVSATCWRAAPSPGPIELVVAGERQSLTLPDDGEEVCAVMPIPRFER